MKKFTYTAKNAAGDVLRDEIDADSRQHALTELRRKGLTVVSLMEVEQISVSEPTGTKLRKKMKRKKESSPIDMAMAPKKAPHGKKIRLSDMAVFCRQLAISINSGLPLREALEGIHEDMDVPSLKTILANIIKQLHDGIPFSKAVAAHPKTFSPIFIGMIRAAEEAGSLPETLNQLAGYLEASDKLRRKISSLMAYPAFVAGFFTVICMIMVFAIIPRFQEIFSDLGSELPKITRVVFGFNRVFIDNFRLILIAIVMLVLFYQLFKRSKSGGLRIAKMKLKLPLTGSCLSRYIIARICRCMAIMLKSGVPISTTLKIVSGIGNNQVIESAIIQAQTQIISGSGIADGLGQTKIFPALLIRMLNVGENAGKLPDVLDRVADAYEDQVEAAITTGTALLEPIIITIFGLLVLLLVISIYLPVFTVSMSVR